jgi:predicted GNAT family N-acyltransferase
VELVELDAMTERDWAELLDGEERPYGAMGADMSWRPKDRHVALRDGGRLVAVGGTVVAEVEVAGAGAFAVVGVGSVVVTRSRRGQGLVAGVLEPLLERADDLGPERAMLFCRPQLVELYRRWGFAAIDAPVWADQPGGRVPMPQTGMWRPLRDAAVDWPPGRVDVRGLPF